jgi:hypothetical protein
VYSVAHRLGPRLHDDRGEVLPLLCRPRQDRGEHPPHHLGDRQRRFDLKRVLQRLHHALQHLTDTGFDQLFLTAEPAVDDAGGDPRLGHDIFHGRGVEPVAGEPAPGRDEDLAATPLNVPICHARHATP